MKSHGNSKTLNHWIISAGLFQIEACDLSFSQQEELDLSFDSTKSRARAGSVYFQVIMYMRSCHKAKETGNTAWSRVVSAINPLQQKNLQS